MNPRRFVSYFVMFMSLGCTQTLAKGSAEPGALRPGLPWVQFHSPDFTRPAETGVDRKIDLDTGSQIQGYSRIWKGLIRFPAGGEIRFHAEADDGLELWIGEELVIDGWGPQRPRDGKCAAQAGQLVPIEVIFYQNGGTACLRLFWGCEGQPQELIPESAFYHQEADSKLINEMMAGRATPGHVVEDKSGIYMPGSKPATDSSRPIRVGPGPHLFVDDFLIEASSHITRKMNPPVRHLREPVVTGSKGKGDNCFQPYMSILRDPKTGRFRIWYGVFENASRSHVGYMESDDGINWIRPHRVLEDPAPIQFGVSILDEGPEFPEPTQRFKNAYWFDGGLHIAVSPDGLAWKPLVPQTVLRADHDITNIYKDRLRNRYMAICSTYVTGPRWSGHRRVTIESVGDDLIHWRRPWRVLTPDDKLEKGETQFYAMCGFLQRGDLLIGMVKVLHDDFAADPGGPKAGVGWTSLAWSRDGEHWTRDREVFFDRHPRSGEWDHAMAWIDWQLPVGDEVYLYYGGYARGHKINRFEERQIGLLRMLRDRYVAREAKETQGSLRTPLVLLDATGMTVNAKVEGELRIRIVDPSGKALPGFDWADCEPIRGDSIRHAVRWKGDLASLQGKPVHVEFSLRNAHLFGFDLVK
jgi:hypothetical protein